MDQARKSSLFSRKIVNVFAGMAYGSPNLPRALREAGYRCHSIEQPFPVNATQQVHPEIVLCSDLEGHSLLIEAKSGANLSIEQLQRYRLVDVVALQRRAFTSAASAQKHNVLIVGLMEWGDRLKMGTALVPSTVRVLAVAVGDVFGDGMNQTGAPSGILRIENAFDNDKLNALFDPLAEVDWDLVPNSFLPVDHDAEGWEFAEFVFPELISAILEGKEKVQADELASTFIRHWPLIANKYKKRLLDRIREVVRYAAQKRFSAYLRIGAKGTPKNEIQLVVPDDMKTNISKLRADLQRRFKDLMSDLKSPQIAIIYEEPK